MNKGGAELEYKRIWEIDVLRTIAIILMTIFHMVYDLNEFAGININYTSGFWFWEGRISALLFMFIAGISSGFSKYSVKRGIKVLGLGMGITIVTYIFLREQYVRFGILHLLGTCMILFPYLKKLNNGLLLIMVAAITYASIPLNSITATTSILLPFGVMYGGFNSVDYYPLIPYLSVFILGIFAYKIYYYKKQSIFEFNYENQIITNISKQSLAIYVIHQPILVATIFLFKLLQN